LAIVVACLACAWFGFWLGFSEMFFEHVERQYASDVAELVMERHWVRCLEEEPSTALVNMKDYLKIRRQGLMLMIPKPATLLDRAKLAADPSVMWLLMQQRDDLTNRRNMYAAFVADESRPGKCGSTTSGGSR
jgi:hypothetical protein